MSGEAGIFRATLAVSITKPAPRGLLLFLQPAKMRDFLNVPYRWTSAYKRIAKAAAKQRAQMRHRVGELWPSEAGQSTSGLARRIARGR